MVDMSHLSCIMLGSASGEREKQDGKCDHLSCLFATQAVYFTIVYVIMFWLWPFKEWIPLSTAWIAIIAIH